MMQEKGCSSFVRHVMDQSVEYGIFGELSNVQRQIAQYASVHRLIFLCVGVHQEI